MPRYVAFLRAINVGGHVVTNERLRALFAELGLARVETFLASGNVVFETGARSPEALAVRIERQLERALGYEVVTVLRTDAEVAALARERPFSDAELARARAVNVAFLRGPAPAEAERALDALRTGLDDFRVLAREVFWLCRARQGESTFSYARFERLLGVAATWRATRTVERLAAKYPPRAAPGAPVF
jgi:uncharacterized protein (DUF1697 family)